MICMPSLVLACLSFGPAGAPVQDPVRKPDQDPFVADDALRQALGADGAKQSADDFTPLGNTPAMPEMRLRAIVKMANKEKSAAVLEIKGVGSYTVREGEKLSFTLTGHFVTQNAPSRSGTARAPANTAASVRSQIPIALRIDRIASDGVVVEVGTLGELLIIR